MLRSRFAPSPTGLLHVGNARSAVLNWAYIKSKGGDFIYRWGNPNNYDRGTEEDRIFGGQHGIHWIPWKGIHDIKNP